MVFSGYFVESLMALCYNDCSDEMCGDCPAIVRSSIVCISIANKQTRNGGFCNVRFGKTSVLSF